MEAGHVYIALHSSLQDVQRKGKKEICRGILADGWGLEELRQKFGRGAILQRYKAWWIATALGTNYGSGPERLSRVTIDDLSIMNVVSQFLW